MFSVYSESVGPADALHPGQERECTAFAVARRCEDGRLYFLTSVRAIERVTYVGADQYGPMIYEWRVVRWLGR